LKEGASAVPEGNQVNRRISFSRGCAAGLLFLLVMIPVGGRGDMITFTKIADENTTVPGGVGTYSGLSSIAAISGDTVAFLGTDAGSNMGVYIGDGAGVTAVADVNTAIPSGTGNFTTPLTFPAISGSTVALIGLGASAQQGVYAGSPGSLIRIADRTTAIPGGAGNFVDFNQVNVLGSTVAFKTPEGVYTGSGGGVTMIADKATAIPGGSGNFARFDDIDIDGGAVTFVADDASFNQGLYLSSGGSLSVLVEAGDLLPGGSSTFLEFYSPSMSGNSVMFYGLDALWNGGLYRTTGGSVTTVADSNTPVPDGTGNFSDFGAGSLAGNAVVFSGAAAGQGGIYLFQDGAYSKIIDLNDTLGGKSISSLQLGSGGFDGNTLGFYARFTDDSTAIYRADLTFGAQAVPEPSGVFLLITGGLLVFGLHRQCTARR